MRHHIESLSRSSREQLDKVVKSQNRGGRSGTGKLDLVPFDAARPLRFLRSHKCKNKVTSENLMRKKTLEVG